MRTWFLGASVIGFVLAVFPVPAQAGGGSQLVFKDGYLVVGQAATARATTWGDGGPTPAGPYSVYLVRHMGFKQYGATEGKKFGLPAGSVRVGSARIQDRSNGGTGVATSFVVPSLPSGPYYVRVCDPGCDHSVNDLYANRVWVAATPAEARLQHQVVDLQAANDKLRNQARRYRRGLIDATAGQAASGQTSAAKGTQQAAQPDPALPVRVEPIKRTPWMVIIAAGFFAMALLLVWIRRRRAHHRRTPGNDLVPFDLPRTSDEDGDLASDGTRQVGLHERSGR